MANDPELDGTHRPKDKDKKGLSMMCFEAPTFIVLSIVVALAAAVPVPDSSEKTIEKRGLSELESRSDHHHVKHVTITKKVPVPYPVEVEKHVPVPVKIPYPVHVEKKVPVIIEKKVPVYVEKKVPVHVDRPVPVEVKVPYEVPVVHKEYVEVPKPYPVHVEKPYPVYVKKPVYIEKPVPVSVHIKKFYFPHEQCIHNLYANEWRASLARGMQQWPTVLGLRGKVQSIFLVEGIIGGGRVEGGEGAGAEEMKPIYQSRSYGKI
uniref:Uncharacterized protein n=1 Tax=Anopheles coluzzii TaxID=1518534 RepID=A0A8W7PZC9_ANOCL